MQTLLGSSLITARQRQVIELIAQGLSNDEVGAELGISPRTAKAHCDALRQNSASHGAGRSRSRSGSSPVRTHSRAGSSWREPTTGADGNQAPEDLEAPGPGRYPQHSHPESIGEHIALD